MKVPETIPAGLVGNTCYSRCLHTCVTSCVYKAAAACLSVGFACWCCGCSRWLILLFLASEEEGGAGCGGGEADQLWPRYAIIFHTHIYGLSLTTFTIVWYTTLRLIKSRLITSRCLITSRLITDLVTFSRFA